MKLQLQLVLLAVCVAVAMCKTHCTGDADCTGCLNPDGHPFQGHCKNDFCDCTPRHKRGGPCDDHSDCTGLPGCDAGICHHGHCGC